MKQSNRDLRLVRCVAVIALALITPSVRAGTVLEWRFDGNLNDTSGNGLHGTWTGGGSPVFGAGPDGSPSIFLDGSHYVKRSVNDAVLRLGAMTVEAYIKPTSLGGQQNILDFRQSNGGYDLRLMGNQQAQFTIQLDGFNGIGITTQIGTVSANRWVHVAATRNASGVSRIYVNGALQRSRSGTNNSTNSTFPFQVGRPVFTAFPDFFHGFIDHVRVSNTALSPDQFLLPVVDCNGNEVMDTVDIANGTSLDCNGNAVPDECDIASGFSTDTNSNGIPDNCDIIIVDSLADPGVPDDGLTTLREAITAANTNGGLTITFDPALAGGTIRPTSQLPAITGGNITIDGDTDNDNIPDIEIDGSLAGDAHGVRIASSGNMINGLIINRFQLEGMLFSVSSPSSNTISNCYVGVDRNGTAVAPNGSVGIWLRADSGASENTLGPGNIISGNALAGIVMSGSGSTGNIIIGNRIGTNVDGTAPIPNGSVGVWIRDGATNNTIGPGNVISGNDAQGIVLSTGATANRIIGNLIGTDTSGMLPMGNASAGIQIREGASANTIGGSDPTDRNIVSGNVRAGILIGRNGDPCVANRIQHNYIGLVADGSASLGNGFHGVIVNNAATDNTIGPGNVISGNGDVNNGASGVFLSGTGTTSNRIVGNLIGTNALGTTAISNSWHGVHIVDGASGNIVGGPVAADRNILSGNRYNGVRIGNWGAACIGNVVTNNLIGVAVDGETALSNTAEGILIDNLASENTIGLGNVISGNDGSGVRLNGLGITDNRIVGNIIGLDATGTIAIGNRVAGIDITDGASSNRVGGADPMDMNIISGNSEGGYDVSHWGVFIHGDGTNDNVVQGNRIGTNADGTATVPNLGVGVTLWDGAKNNVIGGLLVGEGNLISGNQFNGVEIGAPGTSGNQVLGNIIGLDVTGMSDLGNRQSGIILAFEAQHHRIEGNVLSGNGDSESWAAGVLIDGSLSDSNVVRNNLIGTDLQGSVPIPNSADGVRITNGSANNLIGPGNVVSGNTYFGVAISGDKTTANTVEGNFIGTDSTGSFAVPNGAPGVMLTDNTAGNIIGPGNVISGNNSEGLVLENGAHQNTIIGNKCGTDITGSFAIPNFWSGILIQFGGHHNVIGGVGDDGNLCSGNRANGITVRDRGSDFNQILGNYCGTNALGDAPIPNGTDGIRVNGSASNNTIGPGNVVAWNTAHGVRIDNPGSLGNEITANSIFNNVWLGIRLRDGGNGLLTAPKIETLTETAVSGTSEAPNGSVVELYSDGFNEGETFLGSTVVQSGAFEFAVVVPAGSFVTATVTDPDGNTSKFGRFGDEPGSELFGIVTNFGAVQTRGSLVSLDPFGETNIVGNLGFDSVLGSFVRGGFAHRPDGELHLLNEGGNLYQVDPRTGAATLTGNLGYPEVEASAFSSDGFLYVAVADVVDSQPGDNIISLDILLRVHPNSMTTTVIGEIGTDIDGMTFLPSGELVGIDTDTDENGDLFSDIYSIDFSTGQGTLLRSIPDFNIVSLVYQNDMLLGLDGRSGLAHLDTTTWQANMLAVLKYATRTLAAGTAPPLAFGDFDDDGWTNLMDYSVFETCFSFSGPGAGPPFQECLDSFDWNDDGDVDLKDLYIFQRAFTGRP